MLHFEEEVERATAVEMDDGDARSQVPTKIFIDGRLDETQLFPFRYRYSVKVGSQKADEERS